MQYGHLQMADSTCLNNYILPVADVFILVVSVISCDLVCSCDVVDSFAPIIMEGLET